MDNTAKCSNHYGIKLETYVTASTTITSDHYGIGVYTYDDRTGNREIYGIRLEHNGAAVPSAPIQVQSSTWRHFLNTNVSNGTWMSRTATLTCATVGGWIKCNVAGADRYIQLYQSVS